MSASPRVKVVCERCRAMKRPARLATYQSEARALRRIREHCAATGHVADMITTWPERERA